MKQYSNRKVFIACSGVGHVQRGYESFSVELFDQLKNEAGFDLYLLKGGGGKAEKHIRIACLKRSGFVARSLSFLTRCRRYSVEQVTFTLALLPVILKHKPSVIYYSDTIMGKMLYYFRKVFGFRYKLLFCNGAPKRPPFYTEDHVQQLLEWYNQEAIRAGTPAEKLTLLPFAFEISDTLYCKSPEDVRALKTGLGIPHRKKIILSVGAINSYHKRMDYLLREFANLNQQEYYLILLGQHEDESDAILKLADEMLDKNSYTIREVPYSQVGSYFSIADYFVLSSLSEGFGRVQIEALQYGLLPIVHDYPVAREILQSHAVYGDFTKPRVLEGLIRQTNNSRFTKEELWSYAFHNFSWKHLQSRYVDFLVNNLPLQQRDQTA